MGKRKNLNTHTFKEYLVHPRYGKGVHIKVLDQDNQTVARCGNEKRTSKIVFKSRTVPSKGHYGMRQVVKGEHADFEKILSECKITFVKIKKRIKTTLPDIC